MNSLEIKKTTVGIQTILYIASFLVLAVGISLYFLSEQTDVYFSWTINPPLTASFLGSGYLASFLLEFFSAREKIWARACPAIPGVWVFTFLTLIVTLIHLDRFHFDSQLFITQAGTWVWLGIYIGVPVALGYFWVTQIRKTGVDPLRKYPLPAWLRTILLLQGVTMFMMGAALLLLPKMMISLWPWTISILTSQAIGAWGVSIGIIAIQIFWENDYLRLLPVFTSYAFYGILMIITLVRYPDTMDWSRLSSGAYSIFMVSIMLIGLFGTWKARQVRKDHNIP